MLELDDDVVRMEPNEKGFPLPGDLPILPGALQSVELDDELSILEKCPPGPLGIGVNGEEAHSYPVIGSCG